MKTVYVSDDGKYFTDPEECRAYELSKNAYEVEIVEEYYTQPLKRVRVTYSNKQKCQHAVAHYIHSVCSGITPDNIEKYANYEITVRHKGSCHTCHLLSLITEVPAHYKIDANVFDRLIR